MGIERPLQATDEDVRAGRRDGISMSDESDQLKTEVRERFARLAVARTKSGRFLSPPRARIWMWERLAALF